MDLCLRKIFPIEIVEKIMKYVHLLNMKDINYQIRYCITWIRHRDELSYIVSNNFNYYRILELIYEDYDPV